MDWKLELIVLPVTDIDRAKQFYLDKLGFNLDVDYSAGEDFRIVQLTPPGSACSVTLMRKPESSGSVQGLHLVVTDIEAAHAELTGRGALVSEVFHFADGAQAGGPDPARGNYNSFISFSDPDGNGWLVQEANR
ncbi:MAG TPA: VOC family protein [Pseudonocardiaceae bacterium]|jgi:catechol 2,3-dioxygenase-like lactoylglutathione lyase family enzyme|nr:VOC family protein [Pseudonocardiaceae bacterium]